MSDKPADPTAKAMARYWDARAQENAAWYVDTSLAYDAPDMDRFWATGRDIVRQALDNAPVTPDRRERAVELGPGLGRVCKALTAHFDDVIGIDVSAEMVERASVLVPEARFEVGDGRSLRPVDDASADFVLGFTVLQHVPSRQVIADYVADAGRVLRPGGVLAVQWNNQPPLRYRLGSTKFRVLRRMGRLDDERVAPQFLGTTASVAFVRRRLEAAGLTMEGTTGEGTLFCWVWAGRR